MANAFYLATQSGSGFYSLFDSQLQSCPRRIILKGSAGSGKSTCLKKVAQAYQAIGEQVWVVPCASDPDSLDAVLLPRRGICLADGTPPHVIEPRNPMADDAVYSYYTHIDPAALYDKLPRLDAIQKTIQLAYADASAALHMAATAISAAQAAQTVYPAALKATVQQLYARLSPAAYAPDEADQTLLLTAYTAQGRLMQQDTLTALCPKLFLLEDPTGLAAGKLLAALAARLKAAGIGCIRCPEPLMPKTLQAILLPQAGCGVMRILPGQPRPTADSTVLCCDHHLSPAAIDHWLQAADQQQAYAAERLADAKAAHDELEAIYAGAMDWQGVEQTTQQVVEHALQLLDQADDTRTASDDDQ